MCVCEVQADNHFRATCVRIIDGDTIDVIPENTNKLIRIRLWGIDAPETHQPCGIQATQNLAKKILGQFVEIAIVSTDIYGRLVGNVYCSGVYINKEMISDGYAWHYEKYAPQAIDFANAQIHAKNDKLGLWNNTTPVPPWVYRRRNQEYSFKMEVSPLIAAAAAGHIEVVLFLLQSGGDATAMTGKQALFAAIQSGQLEVVKLLLESGLDISTENETYDEKCVRLCSKNKFTGTCIRINDGDSIDICTKEGHIQKIHLYGIDAPELPQMCGIQSLQFLLDTIHGKTVEVEPIGESSQGEHVANVFCEETLVNYQIVSEGWARTIEEIGHSSHNLESAENKAITKQLGIWSNLSRLTVSPSQFRNSPIRINYTGIIALYIAAYSGNLEISKLLLEHGVKIDNAIGSKALSYAKESGNLDLVMFLFEKGAKEIINLPVADFQIHEIDTSEILPLTSCDRESPFSLLQKNTSNQRIDKRENNIILPIPILYTGNLTNINRKNILLIKAAAKGDIEQVKKLVAEGANPNITYPAFLFSPANNVTPKQGEALTAERASSNKSKTSEKEFPSTATSANTSTRFHTNVNQSAYRKHSTHRSGKSFSKRTKSRDKTVINEKYVVGAIIILLILFIWFIYKDWYHFSIKKDSLFLTKLFYKLGFNINAKGDRRSALYYAVLYGRETIVNYLISIDAELESGKNNLIILACMNSHYKIASILLKNETTVNEALTIAVKKGNTNIIRYIFDSKPETRVDQKLAKSLLEIAIRNNQTHALKTLIELGCFPDNSDLSLAILHRSDPSITQILLNYGLKFNNEHLMDSIIANNKNLFMQIINTGMDVNYSNEYGESCLEKAIRFERTEFALLLIEKGADVLTRKPNSVTLMNKAAKKHMYKVVEKIREKGGCMYASEQDAKVKAMRSAKKRNQ